MPTVYHVLALVETEWKRIATVEAANPADAFKKLACEVPEKYRGLPLSLEPDGRVESPLWCG
jgi:hypothetical protein